jgi:hypothetical protein
MMYVPNAQFARNCEVRHKNYGHLPIKEIEAEPLERLCVDLIGPFTIKRKGSEFVRLWHITLQWDG